MKLTKEIHPIWKEWCEMPHEIKNRLHFTKSLTGKWHYHYENKNGIIGLIRIQVPTFSFAKKPPNGMFGKYMWEACGILEYQRFSTKKEAEIEIYKALKEKS